VAAAESRHSGAEVIVSSTSTVRHDVEASTTFPDAARKKKERKKEKKRKKSAASLGTVWLAASSRRKSVHFAVTNSHMAEEIENIQLYFLRCSQIEQICTSEWIELRRLTRSYYKQRRATNHQRMLLRAAINRGVRLVSSQQEVQHDLVEPGRVLQLRSVAGLLDDLQPSAPVQRPEEHGNVRTGQPISNGHPHLSEEKERERNWTACARKSSEYL
jgi:hypothetical protein